MSDDLIKRSDAIKIMACEMYAEAQSQGYETDSIEDFMPEAKAWLNDAPTIDIPHGDDWEKYSERLWKRAYERGKADRPSGEWIYIDEPMIGNPYGRYKCSECNLEEPFTSDFCPNCGSKMRGEHDD